MLSNEEIGVRIHDTRIARSLTLGEIAAQVGVAESTIQRYEKGTISRLKLPVLESIASVLRVNPNWLIGNVEDSAPVVGSMEVVETEGSRVLSAGEAELVDCYRSLNPDGQTAALAAVRGLTCLPEYRQDSPRASAS